MEEPRFKPRHWLPSGVYAINHEALLYISVLPDFSPARLLSLGVLSSSSPGSAPSLPPPAPPPLPSAMAYGFPLFLNILLLHQPCSDCPCLTKDNSLPHVLHIFFLLIKK